MTIDVSSDGDYGSAIHVQNNTQHSGSTEDPLPAHTAKVNIDADKINIHSNSNIKIEDRQKGNCAQAIEYYYQSVYRNLCK